MNIVIIEDEHELGVLMRNFIVKQLSIKLPDQIVKIATSIAEGLTYVRKLKPELVFIDNNLPDGKGIQTISVIKALGGSSHVPTLVMMSAMTNLKEEALKNGADYFLDKPISFVEVSRIIKEQVPGI